MQEACHFLPGGGSRKLGASDTFSQIQRGIKRFFKIEKGGPLIFFKRNKIFCLTFQLPEKVIVRYKLGDENSNGTFQLM